MAPPPRRSRRLALKHVSIADLPEPALRRILLGSSDNLLRFVAACARVCGEWWRVVGGSAAYGRGLGAGKERARVLRAITKALERQGVRLQLGNGQRIGDAGVAVLEVALHAIPTIHFTELHLYRSDLTVAGAASLARALRRPWGDGGLRALYAQDNRGIGDAGVAALAKALPPTLEELSIANTGCGDDGLAALAAALPTLVRLTMLRCHINPAVGARGWVALAGALPSLPALAIIDASSTGMVGSEGAAALAAAIPQCPRLRSFWLNGCGLGEQAAAALRVAEASVPRSAERPNGLSIYM